MQDSPAASGFRLKYMFIIPVKHHDFIGGVHILLVEVFRTVCQIPSCDLIGNIRILFFQQICIYHLCHKDISGLLDILNSRLPGDVQHIDTANFNISQAVLFGWVPHHCIHRCSDLWFIPAVCIIGLCKTIVF